MKRSGINPSAATRIQTGFIPVLILVSKGRKGPQGNEAQRNQSLRCNTNTIKKHRPIGRWGYRCL